MVQLPKSFLGLILALSLVVAGCRTADQTTSPEVVSTPAQTEVDDASSSGDTVAQPSDTQDTDTQKPVAAQSAETAAEGETVTVSIYVMDAQCNNFVQESVQVSPDNVVSDAIGKVISDHEYDSFKLAGYRVQVDQEQGVATVDLRLSPDSERQFVSLSSCEQRTLFGGIEETLLKNPDWDIQSVQFTNRGEAIVL